MSFGLCHAPATFQKVMNDMFRPLLRRGVLVYMDDICLAVKTAEEHNQLLREVMEILAKNQFLPLVQVRV